MSNYDDDDDYPPLNITLIANKNFVIDHHMSDEPQGLNKIIDWSNMLYEATE